MVSTQFNEHPFGADISNEAVGQWLSQFADDERPIAAKLLSRFDYYSSRRVSGLVKELYRAIMDRFDVAALPFGSFLLAMLRRVDLLLPTFSAPTIISRQTASLRHPTWPQSLIPELKSLYFWMIM
jgi:hypothetical protein